MRNQFLQKPQKIRLTPCHVPLTVPRYLNLPLRVDKVVRFLEADEWWWKVTNNGDDFLIPWALIHKSPCQSNPGKSTTQLLYRTVTDEVKVQKFPLSGIAWPSCLPTWAIRQALRYHHHAHPLSSSTEGGGGCHRKGRWGFSGLNTKPDTDSQSYLTI